MNASTWLTEAPGASHMQCTPVQALSEAVLSSFSDEQNYLLRDAEAEVLFSFSLEESLRRAYVSPLFKVRLDWSSDQLLQLGNHDGAGGLHPESWALPTPPV